MAKSPAPYTDLNLDPPTTEPATHTVLSTLREKILTGGIAPGARLRAEWLAAEMNVSRTPIRSALAILAAEGVVTYSVNRGYTVRAITIGDVLSAVDIRASLEATACRLAIERGWSDEDLARLERYIVEGRAIIERGEWSEALEYDWYALNRLIHHTIQRATHNTVLRHAMRMTILSPVFGDVIRVSPPVAAHIPPRLRQIPTTPPPHVIGSQADHEAILAAIRADDAEGCERLMFAHVMATKARVHAMATLR